MLLYIFPNNLKMENRNSPQSPPMREQVPTIPRLGIKIPLGLPEHLPEQEMTPSPIAPNENDDNFLGLFCRADVESFNNWATVSQFMRGNIGNVVQKPDVTEDYKQFFMTMYG